MYFTDHCSADASALCSTDSKHDTMCSGSRASYSNWKDVNANSKQHCNWPEGESVYPLPSQTLTTLRVADTTSGTSSFRRSVMTSFRKVSVKLRCCSGQIWVAHELAPAVILTLTADKEWGLPPYLFIRDDAHQVFHSRHPDGRLGVI